MTSPTDDRTALEQEAQRRLLPLEICDGHDVGNKPLSCINCARQLGRKEGMDEVSSAKDAEITALRAQVAQLTQERDEAYGYLSRLFTGCAPHCEPLSTLPGVATQIDNYIAGLRERAEHAEARLTALEAREQGLREELERVLALLPGPVWNEHKVLVWSALDTERLRAALAASPAGAQTPPKIEDPKD